MSQQVIHYGVVTVSSDIPDILRLPDEFRRQLTIEIGRIVKNASERMQYAAQQGYSFEPLHSSFQTVQRASSRNDEFVAGISTADLIFPFVEDDTKPHWPPYGPDSAIARWVDRLPGPRPPFKDKITPFLAARSIARGKLNPATGKVVGTIGKKVVNAAWQREAERFPRDVVVAVKAVVEQSA